MTYWRDFLIFISYVLLTNTGLDRLLGLQDVEAPRISGQSSQEGGKVAGPKHRPPLLAGDIPVTNFC